MDCFTEWTVCPQISSVVCVSPAVMADNACTYAHGHY